ncbi:hypothetical protein F511_26954 [Dorcoceras hygrometricum]|uniref:RING-type domain-containing protein n=1 Tax=Dorcoceras hygrometricum TaxID=472368 RepID=A0A2Z7AIH8_9LAMI|nr:hypothetical protein F511_26954 [Dorcoceras hygrometricum]
MTRPAWLPPLNSHENYSINVGIHQFNSCPISRGPPRNRKSIGVTLTSYVEVRFYSDDVHRQDYSPFDGLALCQEIRISHIPSSEVKLRNCVTEILQDREIVPFKLDKIECYRETDELEPMVDQSFQYQVRSQRDLVSRITDFLYFTMHQYSQTGGADDLTLALRIEKLVTIPDQELEAWTAWYEEQNRANPCGFEKEYWAAISVPRTVHELWYESSMLAYESAAKSCIESLEKLVLEEGGDTCTICLEEWRKGEEVTKLPCSHAFHADCAIQWLKTSHFCPICRFMLPTS